MCIRDSFVFALNLYFTISQYSESQAVHLWNLCRISYCDPEMIQGQTCGPICQENLKHMKDIKLIREADTKLLAYTFFNKTDSNLYVVYRGTNNLKNWWQDFEAIHVNYPKCKDCKVHKGFLDDTNSLTKDIKLALNEISQKNGNTRNLVVTGHSLGAALAILGTAELYNDFNIIHTYNYGSPRVGNQKFAEWYNSLPIVNKYRVTHKSDMVPHAPFQITNYKHCLLYTSPSPRDKRQSRMPSSA
eukprot:TRINITY_DN444_c0_g1_i2.p1 TRINITY_DN444_c0_g1~~TRINITY_DN444_c0_g1_i2.p1  ORF type:complete len:245 (+),score=77.22 TRINITY_DN444_c0_g1_i2:67-801(+)